MLLFFYGADGYRSHQKLLELKARYIDASLGDTNLSQVDVTSCSVDQLASSLLAYPFLAKTRLVILAGLLSRGPKLLHEKLLDLIEKIPDTTVAVIYEPGIPDRRTTLFKTLLKQSKATEFKPLQGRQLAAWIDQALSREGVQIEPAARDELVVRTEGETWALASELGKLASFVLDRPAGARLVTRTDVDQLVTRTPTEEIFALTDAIAGGQTSQALGRLRTLVHQGESPQLLVGLVASALRTLVQLRDALDRGATDARGLASATGLAPFVVSKHLAAAKATSLAALTAQFGALARLDLATKTGTIDSEVGLELFVVGMVTQPQNHSQKVAERSASFSE